MSAWLEAIEAADAVRHEHGLKAAATGTTWLDGVVGGRLGVRVTLPDGREVTGTPREIRGWVAAALAQDAPAGEALPDASPAGPGGRAAAIDADLEPFPPDQFEYRVVADRLAARIRGGEFGESGKLPSARELMAHYGVGAGVVSHARRELKERGLVYSDRWRGTFTA